MRKSMVLGVALALGVTACGDSTGPTGDRLSRAEALHLTTMVMASSEGVGISTSLESSASVSKTAAAGPPTSFSHTHESTHPCPSGGQLAVTLAISGTFDDDTHSLQAELDGSHTHSSCAFPHNDLTLTVTGAPSIGFSASIGAVNGEPSQPFTFSLDGAFRWEASDGRSGTCPLELDAVTDFIAGERTVQGVVCGHALDERTTWTVG